MEVLRNIRHKKGFTLIELLIVMVLLSILVAIATGSYASSSKRGRDNRRKNDLRNLSTALEAYFNDKGRYPASNANGEMVGCCATNGCGDTQVCSWGGQFKDTNGTLYMVLIPSDPSSGQKYYYVGGTTIYKLYTHLENTRDEGTGVNQTGYTGTNCINGGNALCTYGIASSNTTP